MQSIRNLKIQINISSSSDREDEIAMVVANVKADGSEGESKHKLWDELLGSQRPRGFSLCTAFVFLGALSLMLLP